MPILNVFILLGFVLLAISFFIQGRSTIWGGATLGLLVGIVIGIIKHDFSDILRAISIGADVGFFTIILSWVGSLLKRK